MLLFQVARVYGNEKTNDIKNRSKSLTTDNTKSNKVKKMFSENPRENIPGTSTRNTQGKCIFFNASADKQEFFENYNLEKQLLSFPRNTFNDMSRTSLELNARGTGGLYIFFCNALPMMYLEVEKVSNLVSILVDENYDVTMFCLFYRFV